MSRMIKFGWNGVLVVKALLSGVTAANAHGSGEIEIFSYLLEEPGFFRLTAGTLGTVIFLLGVFIAWQGYRLWRWQAEEEGDKEPEASAARMMAPGSLLIFFGAVTIFAAAFILPDKIESGRHHPTYQEKAKKPRP